MHVLIIEDEPLIAMSVEDALREGDCVSFDFANSVEQAVAAAKVRCPDLITADVDLSPGCGIDAVAAICGGAPIPVIFITSKVTDVHVRRPGSIIVQKPFNATNIKDALNLALAPNGRGQPVPSP